MSLQSAARLTTTFLRQRQALASTHRAFSTAAANNTSRSRELSEKHYVRIAGPASYATREDLEFFLNSHGVAPTQTTAEGNPKHSLVQGQSDVFQNQSIWIYDAGTASAAEDAAARLSGRIAGLKLVRAAPVDQRLVDEMIGAPDQAKGRRPSLRRRMNVIQPLPEERGRTLLATNLPFNLAPRFLWGFFASYDVLAIRHLRRSGVASIIFASEDDAYRAMRERSNLSVQSNKQQLTLKLYQ